MSADEAAEKLGVSARQVRRLASSGGLAAQRVGSRWIVDDAVVRERARLQAQPGRPLSAAMAWAVLDAMNAALEVKSAPKSAERIEDRRVRHRLRSLLDDPPPVDRWNMWLRRRAEPIRLWVHPGVVERFAGDRRVHAGGAPALARSGFDIAVGGPDRFYVRQQDLPAIVADYRARRDDDGQFVVMVVPPVASVPALGESGEPVPAAVALVDLLESADARERHAAEVALGKATRRAAGSARSAS